MKTNRLSFGPFLRRVLLALSLQCVLCVPAIGQIVVKGDSMTAVEAIRQIESKTLAKLRHPSRSQKLKDYLED